MFSNHDMLSAIRNTPKVNWGKMTKLDPAFGVSKGLRRVQLHLCRHGDLQIDSQGLKLVLGDVIFSIIAGVILQGGPLLVINGVIYIYIYIYPI